MNHNTVRVWSMKQDMEDRARMLGEYIVSSGGTVRLAAAKFGVSKSTVHKDVTSRLRLNAPELHKQVAVVLQINKSERPIRGGQATKEMYQRKFAEKHR